MACIALAALLAACAPRNAAPAPESAQKNIPSSASTRRTVQDTKAPRRIAAAFERASSGGIGDSVYAGLVRLAEERNGRIIGTERKSEAGAAFVVHCLSSRLGGEDYEQILRQLAASGSELVICAGGGYLAAALRVAAGFPGTAFAIIDAPVLSESGSASLPGNVTALSFAFDEAAFLAGVYAASVFSKKRQVRLGFIGGMDRPDIRTCFESFRAGAVFCSPSYKKPGAVVVKYCGRTETGFADPASAKTLASALYASGVDIIFHAAGISSSGIFEAAVESGAYVLGSDYDQAAWCRLSDSSHHGDMASCILGSAVKRGDVAVHLLVREFFATGLPAGYRKVGTAQGCIDIVQNLPPTVSTTETLAQARAFIVSGGLQSSGEQKTDLHSVRQ